jgi:hypothetical protein
LQVLGDLIRLPLDGESLPLPWWQRAPLGFLHGTGVYVGLVQSSRPVGDIVVSVLDINKWDNILRLQCTHDDEGGVLASLMDAVLPLNIALAEAVTTETGKEHLATLFCEDKGMEKVKNAIPRIKEFLKQRGFRGIQLEPFLSPIRLPILRSCESVIHHGWLRGIPFLDWIRQVYEGSKSQAIDRQIDLTHAVVSADTDNRILRYVFPNKGAKTVNIVHIDRPGALRHIFSEFAACHMNVLSALLRRGGQEAGYAELIAVCEPEIDQNPLDVYRDLREKFKGIDQRFDAKLRLSDGRPAQDVIYIPLPGQTTPAGKIPICFLSNHVIKGDRSRDLTAHTARTLEQYDCWLLQSSNADPERGWLTPSLPMMERAAGAVILFIGVDGNDSDARFDFMHVLGYLRALCKPILVLTDAPGLAFLERWTDSATAAVKCLAEDEAVFQGDHVASIEKMVADWIRTIRRKL